MTEHHGTILNGPEFRGAVKRAWTDTLPGIRGGHEEGGFIRDATGLAR